MRALRRQLGTQQAKVAQYPNATRGGNSTRRRGCGSRYPVTRPMMRPCWRRFFQRLFPRWRPRPVPTVESRTLLKTSSWKSLAATTSAAICLRPPQRAAVVNRQLCSCPARATRRCHPALQQPSGSHRRRQRGGQPRGASPHLLGLGAAGMRARGCATWLVPGLRVPLTGYRSLEVAVTLAEIGEHRSELLALRDQIEARRAGGPSTSRGFPTGTRCARFRVTW